MTTIATDGVTIAGDGRSTNGWTIVSSCTKKIAVGVSENGRPAIFAITGVLGILPPLMEWVAGGRNGPPPECKEAGGWALLIIDATGYRRIESETPYPFEVELPHAMGSGRDFAQAALDLGFGSVKAVQMAIARDAASGGEIQVIDIASVFAQPTLAMAAE